MIKKEIRKNVSYLRKSTDKKNIEEYSELLSKKIIEGKMLEIIEKRPVFMYASYNNEADTFKMADFFIKNGNKVAYPKVLEGNRRMSFFKVSSLDELEYGYRGIFEPTENECVDALSKEAVMIVPMVAFDKELNRVGYGGGFYDTYLAENPPWLKIGIAFEMQCFDIEDVEKNDIKMDYVITEKNIYGGIL